MSESQTIYRATEHDEQAAFVADVLYRYANDPTFFRPLFFAPMNGAWVGGSGRGKFALIAKYKAAGMTPGVADILYLQPRGGFAFLAIEMKAGSRRGEKGGGLSEDQVAFLDAAGNAGAVVSVCYSADEAIDIFDQYMKGKSR